MPKPRRETAQQPLANVLLAPRAPPAPAPASQAGSGARPVSPAAGAPRGPVTPSAPPPASALPALFAYPNGADAADAADWAELHERTYAVVALALRAYVQQWYVRFSPRDTALLPAINADVVAPLTRVLLALDRARIHDLILTAAPTIAATHLATLRSARAAAAAGFAPSTAQAYHARLPLLSVALAPPPPYVSSQQAVYALSPTYLSALVDALLSTALPPAEYASDAERLIVREVLARSVLASVGRRLAAPWFWAQLGLKLVREPAPTSAQRDAAPLPRRMVAGAGRAWTTLLALVVGTWHFASLLVAAWRAAPPPPRARVLDPWRVLVREAAYAAGGDTPPPLVLRCVVGGVDAVAAVLSPAADRLVPHLLDTLLTPRTGARLVALLERVLFPDGWPTPPPVEPTPDEAAALDAALRARVASRLRPLAPLGIGPDIVTVLANPGCNAHLVAMALSAIAAALVPSLVAEDSKLDARVPAYTDPLRGNSPRASTPEVKVEHVP